MKTKNIFLTSLLLLIFSSCSSDENFMPEVDGNVDDSGVTATWTVPRSEIFDGTGKDGIRSIDSPVFLEAGDAEVDAYMNNNDLVVGVVVGNVAKAYPHRILDWHEIVNDDVSGEKITISYCPLTGTAFGWESSVDNEFTEFGVSGLLYNTNLILYDRGSDSYWSQLKLECINGKFIRSRPKVVNTIETTWGLWKKMFPGTKILSNKQGFGGSYLGYPYGNYKENSVLYFPVVTKSGNFFQNKNIPMKNRVHAIIGDDSAKVFEFRDFGAGRTIRSRFLSSDVLVVGNQGMINSYILESQHANLIFEYDFSNPGHHYFKDNEGNKWNVLGVAVEGPRKGEVLVPTNSLMSYWFAIPSFFSYIQIF
jgi:hypothetical protein